MPLSELNQIIQHLSGKSYSLVTGNGTSALYLALKAISLKPGAEIVVSNISCPDVVYAVLWAGYKPYFVDTNRDDYNISLQALRASIKSNPNIKGIIAVHLFGAPCDIQSICDLSKNYGIFVIEDCAQSFGNKVNGHPLGSFGDVSIFSFGNGKIIEAGHGGSLQSNNEILIKKASDWCRTLPTYNPVMSSKYAKVHRKIYYMLYPLRKLSQRINFLNQIFPLFFKGHYLHQLDSSQERNILKRLKKFEVMKAERMKNIELYNKELKYTDGVTLPPYLGDGHQLSRLTVVVENAEEISKRIRDAGIPSNTMYPVLIDRFTPFFDRRRFNNSYYLNDRLLNLWTNNISEGQLRKSIDIIKQSKKNQPC